MSPNNGFNGVEKVHSNRKQISGFEAYGILIHDSKILLARKKSGSYRGLLDLPGGAIEFGGTPEEALKRK